MNNWEKQKLNVERQYLGWTPEEDKDLSISLTLFMNEIAKKHKRSLGAIDSRIRKLLKVNSNEE